MCKDFSFFGIFICWIGTYLFDIKFMFLFLFFVQKRMTMLPSHLSNLLIFYNAMIFLIGLWGKVWRKKNYKHNVYFFYDCWRFVIMTVFLNALASVLFLIFFNLKRYLLLKWPFAWIYGFRYLTSTKLDTSLFATN